jgi:hypothetical protein
MTIFLWLVLPSIISLPLSVCYIKLRGNSVYVNDLVFCILMSLPIIAVVNILVVAHMFLMDSIHGKLGNKRIW